MKTWYFTYRFHAVGQGLFASGSLGQNIPTNFNWVFDCGSTTGKHYLSREMESFHKALHDAPIALFCLSHFDKDHINGAKELLSKHRVDVLVLPYASFVERIYMALKDGDISPDYFRFLVDPVAYLFEVAGNNLGEIVFVMGEEQVANQEYVSIIPPAQPSDPWRLGDSGTPGLGTLQEEFYGNPEVGSANRVSILSHHRSIRLNGIWEFLFFNEHISQPGMEGLRQKVAKVIKKHKLPGGLFNGARLLQELNQLYEVTFGSTGPKRNQISLVTYAGPVEGSAYKSCCLAGSLIPVGITETTRFYLIMMLHYLHFTSPNVSIAYFGDFPLKPTVRIDAVRKHCGGQRWKRLQVVQIPHHGAKSSWVAGSSAQFQHQASVISSARVSKQHPASEVLADLANHGIMLVNEMQAAHFQGTMMIP